MELRPATTTDIARLAELVLGEISQASTAAGMRLFGIETAEDALELNRVMIASTGSWESTTVAEVEDGIGGMAQVGEASMAFTPEVIALAHRLYGDEFQAFLAPRLAAQAAVQGSYPPDCLRLSEIHVAPERRGAGIGSALLGHVLAAAAASGMSSVGLQTLTTNPARAAFEAWGFRVVETTTDTAFEQLTGAAGYHLMVRPL